MRRIVAANTRVMTCATSSPSRKRSINARGPALGGTAPSIVVAEVNTLVNKCNRLQFFRYHGLRQLCVCQGFGHFLSVAEHPLEEILDRIALR